MGRFYPDLPVIWYIWDDVIPTYRNLVHMGRCYPYLPVSWYIWDDVIPTYP